MSKYDYFSLNVSKIFMAIAIFVYQLFSYDLWDINSFGNTPMEKISLLFGLLAVSYIGGIFFGGIITLKSKEKSIDNAKKDRFTGFFLRNKGLLTIVLIIILIAPIIFDISLDKPTRIFTLIFIVALMTFQYFYLKMKKRQMNKIKVKSKEKLKK